VPVRVQAASLHRDDPRAVGEIIVGADAQGAPVALADIATLSLDSGPANIERTTAAVHHHFGQPRPDTPLGNVQQVIQREIDAQYRIPALACIGAATPKRWTKNAIPSPALLF